MQKVGAEACYTFTQPVASSVDMFYFLWNLSLHNLYCLIYCKLKHGIHSSVTNDSVQLLQFVLQQYWQMPFMKSSSLEIKDRLIPIAANCRFGNFLAFWWCEGFLLWIYSLKYSVIYNFFFHRFLLCSWWPALRCSGDLALWHTQPDLKGREALEGRARGRKGESLLLSWGPVSIFPLHPNPTPTHRGQGLASREHNAHGHLAVRGTVQQQAAKKLVQVQCCYADVKPFNYPWSNAVYLLVISYSLHKNRTTFNSSVLGVIVL